MFPSKVHWKCVSLSTQTFTPPTTPVLSKRMPSASKPMPSASKPSSPPSQGKPSPPTHSGQTYELDAQARIAALEAEVARLREHSAHLVDCKQVEGKVNEDEDGQRPGARVFAAKAAGLQADIDGCWDVLATPSSQLSGITASSSSSSLLPSASSSRSSYPFCASASPSPSPSLSPPPSPNPSPISNPDQLRIRTLNSALADSHFKNRALAICLEDAVERAERAERAEANANKRVHQADRRVQDAKAQADRRVREVEERMRGEHEVLVRNWARSLQVE
ncbi:hypothetical protein CcaverHIS631_0703600 [Cutaneotrichosporon cavernicola]|nr:hypothetical protein CcaverHIS631_0703600 [Cutaneotrichosporon cavernicola]